MIPAAAGTKGGRRWAWLLTLVVGVVLFEQVRRTLISTGNPNLVPTLILLGAAVVPAAFVAFVYGRRLAYDVSGLLLAFTALVGGVVGVVVAGTWEYHTLLRLGAVPMIAVGFAEETAKLIIPAVVLVVVGYRRPANGLLLGVASGVGFASLETMGYGAALETMGYGFVTLIQSRGNLAAVDGVLVLRGLLSPAAHMAWTGLTAAALWQAAARRWHPTALFRLIQTYLIAVALHATWDSLHAVAGYAVLAAISLGLLVSTAHVLARDNQVSAHTAVDTRRSSQLQR